MGAWIPPAEEFHWLGFGIQCSRYEARGNCGSRAQRGVRCLDPHAATCDFPALLPSGGFVVMAVAIRGVGLAEKSNLDLVRPETQTSHTIWGPTWPTRAKDLVYCLLSPGHMTSSPVMRVRYEQLIWLVARVPGATRVML